MTASLTSVSFFWLQAWLDSVVLKEACSSGPDLNLIQALFTFLQMHFLFVNSQSKFFYLFIFDRELDISKFFLTASLAWFSGPCSSGPDLDLIQPLFTSLQIHFLFVNSQVSIFDLQIDISKGQLIPEAIFLGFSDTFLLKKYQDFFIQLNMYFVFDF